MAVVRTRRTIAGSPSCSSTRNTSRCSLGSTIGATRLASTEKMIELYVAPLADDLSSGTPTVFGHARFIAGTSGLNAAPAGTNTTLTWIDERNGQGILDPKADLGRYGVASHPRLWDGSRLLAPASLAAPPAH